MLKLPCLSSTICTKLDEITVMALPSPNYKVIPKKSRLLSLFISDPTSVKLPRISNHSETTPIVRMREIAV